MANPEGNEEGVPVTQYHAAPQREGEIGAATQLQRDHARGHQRDRGPHPLPLFLGLVARQCGEDRARLARVLAGLRRYQAAPVAAPRPKPPAVAQTGNVTLRDHGGHGRPVVVVPSLINPASVLDLAPGNSLLAALAATGLRPLLVDWGDTEPLGLEELIAERLLPLITGLGEPVALAGYCMGGTFAIAAAALAGPAVIRLALLATPWHFQGYGAGRGRLAEWWAQARPMAEPLGVLPIDLLQPAFWSLDEAGVVAKYERLAAASDTEVAAFAMLEDWSNTGTPLSLAAARGLAETLFADNAPGRGAWRVGGERIDAAALGLPILDVIARRDHIVPAAAALTTAGPGQPLVLEAGHVGMIVGGGAPALLWQPLAEWLRQ
jgi:polyhydroxyalkanoate synthase